VGRLLDAASGSGTTSGEMWRYTSPYRGHRDGGERQRLLLRPGAGNGPAFLLYVDQGEELYVRAEERQRRRFSEVIARGVADPRLYTLMSMRADFLGELQKDEPLFKVHRKIDVTPLREAELREVASRPAELLSARFETAGDADIITRRAVEDSVRDVGALPLLSYMLDDMWTHMVKRGDGVLRLPAQSFELGGVLVDRADAFLANHPKSQDELRRIFTLKLATVREGEEPTRRRAARFEFTDEEWRLVNELANHPNRLLVSATPEGEETYAEVAHEAIFRRWGKLRDWIADEREFLAWKTGLEAARRAWRGAPDGAKNDALLMGFPLAQAQSWFEKRPEDLPEAGREFIALSRKTAQQRRLRVRALVACLLALLALSGFGVIYRESIRQFALGQYYWCMVMSPSVLSAGQEKAKAARSGSDFQECANGCPVMIVVQAGKFKMGSPDNEPDRLASEGPRHEVTIAKPFAVSKFEVTFDEWDACAAAAGCPRGVPHEWGRGQMPVINVSWDEAKQYVGWLSRWTGKEYRLLTEAEWEYAARAGSTTRHFWGDEPGKGNANCAGCGSQWDGKQTAFVGSFKKNAYGLYDMHGNVWEWVEDTWHGNYEGAPPNGSAWVEGGDSSKHVDRGGSWGYDPQSLRAAFRESSSTAIRHRDLGFRVARTLTP
jgi:formylglycine-generating enzyme required for sulfatase activity